MHRILALVLVFVCAASSIAAPASQPTTAKSYTRQENIVYGRSYGAALTFDLFRPTGKANGAAAVFVVSGGWVSAHELLGTPFFDGFLEPLTSRGYTVFAVCHACQPKFQIPEIIDNLNRSVRFIRFHASDYGIDPNRIGITGGSAGGHLSLMQGIAPKMPSGKETDPIDRVSSKVQAVGCFFPPTDFLNYGKPGEDALGRGVLSGFKAPFMFRELDKNTKGFKLITDEERFKEIGRQISPINHVTADDPPTLILHGDADKLVPIQQAEILVAKLKEAGVTADLIVRPGAGHGWKNLIQDLDLFADWFDKHLKKAGKG